MSTTTHIHEEHSRRIFWVVQTVFSLVLARSFLVYKDVVLHPFSTNNALVTFGLILVYGTALWSWIDYSYSTIVSPYRLGKGPYEKFRFLVDLAIVICYAFLLFTLEQLLVNPNVTNAGPNANILPLFTCLTFIFTLYLVSGLLRIKQYGRHTSRVWLITVFLLLNAIVAAGYFFFSSDGNRNWITNAVCIGLAILLMVAYRVVRFSMAKRIKWIAIDVDGVLANQIDGILPIANDHVEKPLTYSDITEWDLKIGETDIATLIVSEQQKQRYVMAMPVHSNAQSSIADLIRNYRIAIATARTPKIDRWTIRWLKENKIYYDIFNNSKEGNKQNIDVDPSLLIDDYIGNIKSFLENSDGSAILFSQPWNQQRDQLQSFIDNGRLKIAEDWKHARELVSELIGG